MIVICLLYSPTSILTEDAHSTSLSNHYKQFYKYECYYYYTMHDTMHKIWILTWVIVTKVHNTQNRYVFTTRSMTLEWVSAQPTEPSVGSANHFYSYWRALRIPLPWIYLACDSLGFDTTPYTTLLTVGICSAELASGHSDPPFYTSDPFGMCESVLNAKSEAGHLSRYPPPRYNLITWSLDIYTNLRLFLLTLYMREISFFFDYSRIFNNQ